jgi:hypothetical protein
MLRQHRRSQPTAHQKKGKTAMKTTNRTITATSKGGPLTTFFALLLAAVMAAAGPLSVSANDSVPFKGNAVGGIVSATPVPGGVLVRVLAEGYATQLGHYSREEVLVLNPVTGTLTGTIVFYAANGDQLFGDVSSQFTSPNTVVGTYTFTGGTGRFENATGGANAVISSPDGVNFTAEFQGNVSSAGANKKQ